MRSLIRTLLIAAALAGLVAILAQLTPERREAPPERAAAPAMPAPARQPDEAGRILEGVAQHSRNVTPDGLTGPQGGIGDLVRLPPRPPLSDPDASESAEARETRLLLLPRPVAVDAGTLRIDEGKIRLQGVAPLALDAGCGDRGWPCGMRSRTALRSWLRARSVRCEAPEGFGEKPETIATRCSLQGEDVGDWIVRNGWAKADPGGPYEAAEAEARETHRGIWREAGTP